ncbi:hypothetical protein HPB47_019526 [Ixodes persulcatus]|uniref:Uncharacterized protein n=1 Tax=Ixodes persulcatus TaxID=34615 RepID=A0AC60QLI5_IXOPE|nr:hypothetical protein HPB47_019526 [Ixodes persulcatus]
MDGEGTSGEGGSTTTLVSERQSEFNFEEGRQRIKILELEMELERVRSANRRAEGGRPAETGERGKQDDLRHFSKALSGVIQKFPSEAEVPVWFEALKARMSPEALSYVTLKEDPSWHRAPELSRLMRLYEQAEGRGAASKNVDAEGSGGLGRAKGGGAAAATKFTGSPAARLGTGQRKQCYGCGSSDHLRADCPHATSRGANGSGKAPSETEKLTARVTTELRSPPSSGLITTRLACGGRELGAVLDTGADITVVREAMVPDELKTPCGKICLESAFGESVEANLALLPLAFLDRGSFAEVREAAPVLCALTNRLTSRTDCLLSGEAWETLHGAINAEAPLGTVVSVAAGEAVPSVVSSPAAEPGKSVEMRGDSTETEVEDCAETSSSPQTDDTETDDGLVERSKFREQELGDPSLLEAWANGHEGRVQGIGVAFQEDDNYGDLECTPRRVRGCQEAQLPDGQTAHLGGDAHSVRAVFDRHRRLLSPNTGIAKRPTGYAGDDRVSGHQLWCGATLSGTEGCANVTELSAVAVANLMYGRVGPQLTIGGLTPRGFEKV